MIVVEVGHAHVITFLPLSCELSVLSLSLSFFSFSAVMRFLFIFVKLTIESRNIELFCTQFNSRVYSLIHIILMFFFYVERQP
jgi:hypothetical protein